MRSRVPRGEAAWVLNPSAVPQGARLMLVASSHYEKRRGSVPGRRLIVKRPPAHLVPSFCIDSGGFSAARRHGEYPWTEEEYIAWIRAESGRPPRAEREGKGPVRLDFCAAMDYAGAPTRASEGRVSRGRPIRQPDQPGPDPGRPPQRALPPGPRSRSPWLGVLQGFTDEERQRDIPLRTRTGLLHPLMGVGSICGRREKEAARILRLYERELPHIAPGTRPSDSEGRVSFGMDLRTLDHGPFNTLHSWDTHSWDWGMNHRGHHIPESAKRQPGEGKAAYTRRFAAAYMAKVERNLEAYHSLAA